MPTVVIDGSDTPYADEATATTAIANQAIDCLIQIDTSNSATNISAAVTVEVLDTTDALDNPPDSLTRTYVAKVDVAGACDLLMDYDLLWDASAGYGVGIEVYQEDGTTLEDSDSTSGTATHPTGTLTCTITAAGLYWVKVNYGEAPGGSPTSLDATISLYSTDPLTWCTISGAAWDDGTTGTVTCT
jgi:hypothetical protein